MWLIETSERSASRHLVRFLFSLTSPRPCYPRSFRSTRISTAHQYRKHQRYLEARVQNSKWLGCVWTPEWHTQIYLWWLEISWLFSVWPLFFSQIGSPTLLLASKHATFLRFRLTWTSSYVRVRRLGQPRNALKKRSCRYEGTKWVCIGSDRCCLRGNKNWGVVLSVVNNSIIFQGPFQMKWSISPWLCHRSLANSRCLDLEMLCARWGILSSFLSTFWEWKRNRSFDIFWAEKLKRYIYICSNQSRVPDVVFFWSHLQLSIGEVSAVDWGSERRVKCLGWWVSLADSWPI